MYLSWKLWDYPLSFVLTQRNFEEHHSDKMKENITTMIYSFKFYNSKWVIYVYSFLLLATLYSILDSIHTFHLNTITNENANTKDAKTNMKQF